MEDTEETSAAIDDDVGPVASPRTPKHIILSHDFHKALDFARAGHHFIALLDAPDIDDRLPSQRWESPTCVRQPWA